MDKFDLKDFTCRAQHGGFHEVWYDHRADTYEWNCRWCGATFKPSEATPSMGVVYFNQTNGELWGFQGSHSLLQVVGRRMIDKLR